MTTIRARTTPTDEVAADLLVLPIFAGRKAGPGAALVASACGIDLTLELKAAGFDGDLGETHLVAAIGRVAAKAVLFVGLGKRAKAGAAAVRTAAMYAGAATRAAATIASTLPQVGTDRREVAQAFAEGILLGRYRDDRYRTKPEPMVPLEQVTALIHPKKRGSTKSDRKAIERALERGHVHAETANWVRDLVGMPSSECTPAHLASVAQAFATERGLTCTIWDEKRLAKERFGGVIGVGQGGANPPRLIELAYNGGGKGDAPFALTGKGITFDSGGLDIKSAKYMETMKLDMGGAAAMLGVMRALPELGLRINVIAAIACAENMPEGTSQRPGDVLHHRNGMTSEVADTDAEGRLLLSDPLAYLAEQQPRLIIDAATLTDTGLGEDIWAIMGTSQKLVDQLRRAGKAAGEPGWQLPLIDAYERHTASEVADIKNADWEGADTLASGLFLRAFTAKTPWAHIDVGNTAFLEEERAEWPEGPTGNPSRVILRFLEAQAGVLPTKA